MGSLLAGVAGAVAVVLIAAGSAYWAGRKGVAAGLLVLAAATGGVAAWPSTREPLVAMFAEPEEPDPLAAFPTSLPAFLATRPVRMPPDHPDASAPRNGPHFTCHQDNAGQNQAYAQPLSARE